MQHLMRSQALDEEEQQEAAEYIFSEGRRLESLSLKLLDLLVLKKKDFELRPTNLQTVIEGAVHTALPSMADKNISLKGRYDDGFCLMESDLVKSLIIILIDNAKKAIDDSGNILVVGRLNRRRVPDYRGRYRARYEAGGTVPHYRSLLPGRQIPFQSSGRCRTRFGSVSGNR